MDANIFDWLKSYLVPTTTGSATTATAITDKLTIPGNLIDYLTGLPGSFLQAWDISSKGVIIFLIIVLVLRYLLVGRFADGIGAWIISVIIGLFLLSLGLGVILFSMG